MPDCWIGAGYLRNQLWDVLSGLDTSAAGQSYVDVVYFDRRELEPARDRAVEAALIKAQQGSIQPSQESTQAQALVQMQAKTSSQIDQLQTQIDQLNAKIPHARPAQCTTLTSQRDALRGELDLQKALLDSVHKMSSFVEANGEVSAGLEGGINQLARSIPEVLST